MTSPLTVDFAVVQLPMEILATAAFDLSGLLALRDIVCNKIPSAFSDHRPYAICAFLGTWILVLAPLPNAPPPGSRLSPPRVQ